MVKAKRKTLAIAACVLLTACTQTTPTASSPTTTPLAHSHKGIINEDTGEIQTANPDFKWTEQTRRQAIEAAEKGFNAYARRGLPYDQWWANLEPLLNDQAAENYAYVDPANIPELKLTGQSKIFKEDYDLSVIVMTQTNKGRYDIVLVRNGTDEPWKIADIIPIEAGINANQ